MVRTHPPPCRAWLALALWIGATGVARAADNAVDGVVVVANPIAEDTPLDLDGVWRVKRVDDGVDLSAADVDDRAWERVRAPLGLGQQGHADESGHFWYRLRVTLPPPSAWPSPPQLGLQVGAVDSASEVFVDGLLVGGLGELPRAGSPGTIAHDRTTVYAVPAQALEDGALVIAVHAWRSPIRASSNPGRGGITHGPLQLGDARALARTHIVGQLQTVALTAVFLVIGLYHVHLWRRRRELTPYLWFGLFASLVSVYVGIDSELGALALPSTHLRLKVSYAAVFLAVPVFVQFLWPFLGRPIHPVLRALQAWSLVYGVVGELWPSMWFIHRFLLWWWVGTLASCTGAVAVLVHEYRRRNPEARTVMVGIFAVVLTVLNNLARERNLIQTPELTALAFGVCVLAMAASLSNRFTRVYGELDEKNAELRRLDRLKDEFLANTTHELRTPLNGILGITEGILEDAATRLQRGDGRALQDEQALVDNLQMVQASGQRLGSLINDILDFSKLREGRVALHTGAVDVRAAVDVALRLLRPLAERKGLALVNRVGAEVPAMRADEARLQQILVNLVGNAVKFTEQGSVVVEAGHADGRVWFAVIDTGPGVAPADHERVFRDFEQGDGSTARVHGGTGLGLSITKRLVELHEGTIALASSVGSGARFTVSLPRADAADTAPALRSDDDDDDRLGRTVIDASGVLAPRRAPTTQTADAASAATVVPARAVAAPAATGDARDVVILVVDDEPVNVRVLENHLRSRQGFSVISADSGPAALALVEGGLRPDLVLLDVMMPRMTGFEVCQRLRERFGVHEVPVILVTAKDRVADVVAGFEAGANDYLTKPVAKGELMARIDAHVQVAQLTEATSRFVPFEFLSMLGKSSLVEVERGDHVQQEMSVLFSDIRGFTTIVERNTPQENFEFINRYLEHMEPAITSHAGFVDSFIGDAIMALFDGRPAPGNASGPGRGGAVNAVVAGVAMQRALPRLNAERRAAGLPTVEIGVGVNTGVLTCGTIGGRVHIKCGVIGDAVNLASRIEGMTKLYGARLLISDGTHDALPDPGAFSLREVDRVLAKGKATPTTLYEVLDACDDAVADARRATLARFNDALAAWAAHRFADARALFVGCLADDPTDTVAALYVERCDAFIAAPPSPDWDGVTRLTTK